MEIDNTDASSNENACEIKVTFPTSLQAEQALKVLSVDPEPSTRVVKSFRIENEEGSTDEKKACMRAYPPCILYYVATERRCLHEECTILAIQDILVVANTRKGKG
eukprot:scaffold1669_cov129-Cylindrotheca_fusiformis.AAC.56